MKAMFCSLLFTFSTTATYASFKDFKVSDAKALVKESQKKKGQSSEKTPKKEKRKNFSMRADRLP